MWGTSHLSGFQGPPFSHTSLRVEYILLDPHGPWLTPLLCPSGTGLGRARVLRQGVAHPQAPEQPRQGGREVGPAAQHRPRLGALQHRPHAQGLQGRPAQRHERRQQRRGRDQGGAQVRVQVSLNRLNGARVERDAAGSAEPTRWCQLIARPHRLSCWGLQM